MATAIFPAPARGTSDHAFGNLIDLARLRIGRAHAEVCEVCNTINMGSARLCKCCAHKLAAFYASGTPRSEKVVRTDDPSRKLQDLAWTPPDFAALCGRFAGRCRDFHRSFFAPFASAVQALK